MLRKGRPYITENRKFTLFKTYINILKLFSYTFSLNLQFVYRSQNCLAVQYKMFILFMCNVSLYRTACDSRDTCVYPTMQVKIF